MVKTYKPLLLKSTGKYLKYVPVLFLWMLSACKNRDQKISLIWEGKQAVAISISKNLIKSASDSNLQQSVHVTIPGSKNKDGILGNINMNGDAVIFKPLIPLSVGTHYNILNDNVLIGGITIPMNTAEQAPALTAIYPGKDTIPENTLKLYLHFSKPMRTGQSLEHITLLDHNKDTMRNVFLDLKPELWDTSGTVLTLWLDPGRIKRGLVLNQKLGNPLKRAQNYQLIISRQWKDTRGSNLSRTYNHQFVAGDRDAQIPHVALWSLTLPKPGSTQPLIINTRESLDHYLLQESITIIDNTGIAINGTVKLSQNDQQWQFTPSRPWKVQTYKLKVSSRLEDLAGNNLNRVFDRDITKDQQNNHDYYYRVFTIK